MINKKPRFSILDQVRGLAVILMFLSHSIDFFYGGDSKTVDLLRWVTVIVSFTSFIYVSGASSYIAYISKAGANEEWQKRKSRLLIKTFQLLFVYYLVAYFIVYISNGFDYFSKSFLSVLTFKEVPPYTEFLIAFVILSFSLILFGRVYKFIMKNTFVVFILAINIYILGTVFYQVDFGQDINVYKSLLVGHDQGYRFPVFQYLPVYLLGMKYGKELLEKKLKLNLSWVLQLLALGGLSLFFAVTKTWGTVTGEGVIFLQRWPPSVSFLLVGLLFVQILIIAINFKKMLVGEKNKINLLMEFIGKHPLDFYVIHILVLSLYRGLVGTKYANFLIVLAGFTLLLIIVSLIVFIKEQFHSRFDLKITRRINDIIDYKATRQMKHLYRITAVCLLTVVTLAILYKADLSGKKELVIEKEGLVHGIEAPQKITWWDKNYKYYSDISLKNLDNDRLLKKDFWVDFKIDHKKLIKEGKSHEDGRDFSVLYFQNGEYKELEVRVLNINQTDTIISFPVFSDIAPGSSVGNYFLYYGNKNLTQRVQNGIQGLEDSKASSYEVSLGEEQTSVILTEVSRKWYLKNYSAGGGAQEVLYNIQLANSENVPQDDLKVIVKGKIETEFKPDIIEKNIYELRIPLDEIEAGEYSIKTIAKDANFESDELEFNVSYPLFVTWTIDWEGYDVSEDNLKSIDDIANTNNIPLTTFFNPRIFVANDVSEQRKKRLVEWVLEKRDERGDEIGLHLHMHTDMIQAIGLEPKSEPRWGGRENGHDVLTTAYDYDEFTTIVKWALEKFQENNLPRPVSYRAGGWFMDEENLKVLDDLGFKIDSSGREPINYGVNQIKNPWNLTATTKPYKPSINDQNTPGVPSLDLWEFPNNGMDSTNKNFDILSEKFRANYFGEPLEERQVLTYLSHPHWFTQLDEQDMVEILKLMNPHKYDNDLGPVVYTTLEGALLELENN